MHVHYEQARDRDQAHHARRRGRWRVVLPWLVLGYLLTGLYAVQPNEQAMVRRCGRALPQLRGPGLHFGFPLGIDRVDRVRMFEPKRVGVGVGLADRAIGRRADPKRAEGLTGDRNLVLISAIIQYRVVDARAYLFGTDDVPALVRNAAASSLSSIIASMEVDDVLTVQRIAIQSDVTRSSQAILDRCGAGVQVTAVSLEGLSAPQEVARAFRDVTSAREDRQRAINEAQGYANRIVPQTRGQAQRLVLDAEAAGSEIVQKAAGRAERFTKMAGELAGNRELTAKRLILETMEDVLPRLRKIVLDAGANRDLDLGLFETEAQGTEE